MLKQVQHDPRFYLYRYIKGVRHPELVSGSHFQEWDSNEDGNKDAETSSA
jgi:hypothetical protein